MRPRSRRSWAWSEWAAGREGCHGKAVGALLRTSQQAFKALPLHPSTCSACSTVLLPPCRPARRPQWDSDDHVEGNYQRSGLVVDANVGYGRNKRRDVLKEKVRAAGPAAAAAAGVCCWLPWSRGCGAQPTLPRAAQLAPCVEASLTHQTHAAGGGQPRAAGCGGAG